MGLASGVSLLEDICSGGTQDADLIEGKSKGFLLCFISSFFLKCWSLNFDFHCFFGGPGGYKKLDKLKGLIHRGVHKLIVFISYLLFHLSYYNIYSVHRNNNYAFKGLLLQGNDFPNIFWARSFLEVLSYSLLCIL